MTVWLARNKDGGLFMYNIKPIRKPGCFGLPWGDEPDGFEMGLWPLPEDVLQEVTWVNSPKEYEMAMDIYELKAQIKKGGKQ